MSRPPSALRRCAVVTGGSAGIGRATALGLAAAGLDVAIVSRDVERGRSAAAEIRAATGNPGVEHLAADLGLLGSVRGAAAAIRARFGALQILVNNAGIVSTGLSLTEDGVERTLAVNHLAPFLLTNLLLDVLRAGAPSRIVNVSSQVHARELDFEALERRGDWNALEAYRATKLANILFTRELARRLEGTGVDAYCVHPGVAWTRLLEDFGRAQALEVRPEVAAATAPSAFARGVRWVMDRLRWRLFPSGVVQPDEAARAVLYLALTERLAGPSGTYFHLDRPSEPAPAASDPELAARLWRWSERLTGLPQ